MLNSAQRQNHFREKHECVVEMFRIFIEMQKVLTERFKMIKVFDFCQAIFLEKH